MGNVEDSMPVVSQFKSLGQAVSGDLDGARRTQENFSNSTPVISQAKSAIQAATGDTAGAEETQKKFLYAQTGINVDKLNGKENEYKVDDSQFEQDMANEKKEISKLTDSLKNLSTKSGNEIDQILDEIKTIEGNGNQFKDVKIHLTILNECESLKSTIDSLVSNADSLKSKGEQLLASKEAAEKRYENWKKSDRNVDNQALTVVGLASQKLIFEPTNLMAFIEFAANVSNAYKVNKSTIKDTIVQLTSTMDKLQTGLQLTKSNIVELDNKGNGIVKSSKEDDGWGEFSTNFKKYSIQFKDAITQLNKSINDIEKANQS